MAISQNIIIGFPPVSIENVKCGHETRRYESAIFDLWKAFYVDIPLPAAYSLSLRRTRASVFWYLNPKCHVPWRRTMHKLPFPTSRTRRPLFIPRFIIRCTPPPWRLGLPTERRRCIPAELWCRRPSNRRGCTASVPITRVCRRCGRCREIFPGRRRVIRSRVLGSGIGRSRCAAVRGLVGGGAGGKGVLCVGGGCGRRVPGWGATSSC